MSMFEQLSLMPILRPDMFRTEPKRIRENSVVRYLKNHIHDVEFYPDPKGPHECPACGRRGAVYIGGVHDLHNMPGLAVTLHPHFKCSGGRVML